ncbi:MAG TPA: hypothetical protein VJO12_04060 [Stellaceae bacterium]|nr:hypothetical protein [Stellaceae bacterium]
MHRKHIAAAALLLLILFLAGCVAPQPHVTVEDDEFSKEVVIMGWGLYANPLTTDIYHLWRLRSFVDKQTHQVRHQIYVEIHYEDEYQYFNSAADDTARDLPLLVIDLSSTCPRSTCMHYETIGVAIDDATLRARAAQGFRVKLSARRGSTLILLISPTQIGLQLAAIDGIIHPPAPPAAPPPAK